MGTVEDPSTNAMLDAIPAAVLEFDHGHLVYANRSAYQLFDLDSWDPNDPVRALGNDRLVYAIDQTAASGEMVELVVEVHDRIVKCATTRLPDGELVTLVATDITSVERVLAMRRDFVANASHELKTPVTGMLALAESLELAMERDPERAREMAGRVKMEALRLSQLVRELLDLNRLEAQAIRAEEEVDLRFVCLDQVARIRELAASLEVDVRVVIPEAIRGVGSRENYKTIVSNLVANAVKYNRPGGTVRVHAVRNGGAIQLEVHDTGLGIGEEHLDRIFERFYRVDQARSREAGGTGLGLSIVRHAVEQMGGTIQVQSTLGEGSTFTVTIPIGGE